MSSVPSKSRPPKPPRIKKGPSIPNGHIDSDNPQASPTLPSSTIVPSSPTVVPSSAPSSTVSPYKPDGKPGRATSLQAAATISKALQKIKKVEDEKALKQQLEEQDSTALSRTSSDSSRDDPFVVGDQDLSTRSHHIDSLTQDNASQPSPSQSPRVPSSPKPIPIIPNRGERRERGRGGEGESSFDGGASVPLSVGCSSKSPLSPKKDKRKEENERKGSLSSSGSVGKKPLLPPSLKVAPPRPPLLARPLLSARSLSTSEDSKQSQDSHVTPPKGSATSNPDERSKFTFSSTETADSSLPSNNTQTTPTKLTSGGVVTDETMDRGGESAFLEETDGLKLGNKKKLTPITTPPKPLLPSKPGTKLHKVNIKGDDSWIQRKTNQSESPPMSKVLSGSSERVSPSTEKKGLTASLSVPYRSHAIISPGTKRQSTTEALLKDKSKPVVGPSGEYYPPAVRSITPEPFKGSSDTRIKEEEEEEEEEERDSLKGIKRFAKYRRSNSFSGDADKRLRPVSMVDPNHSNKKLIDQRGTLQHQGMSESTIVTSEHQNKKLLSKAARGSIKKKGVFGLFRGGGKQKEEQAEEEAEVGGDSSEDETGGTIKRMPKGKERVDEPASEQEYPHLFQYVFVMGLTEDPSTKKLKTQITYQYPPPSSEIDKEDKPILGSLGQFCFPDLQQWKPVVHYTSESYSFVLTNIDASRRYGYCRRLLPDGKSPRLPEVYCIISPLGCFDLYAKILDIVEQRRTVSQVAVFTFLKSISANPFPAPGQSVSVKVIPAKTGDLETIKLRRPPDSRLEHVDFSVLYNVLGPKKLINVFASLLMERRVILAAQRLSTLSSCCHALLALLYPFEWQHTFIPVLPDELIDFCGSPLPCIFGISPSMVKKLDHLEIEMEEALVVDLDKRKFVRKFDDESSILPNKVSQFLIHMLDAAIIKNAYSRPDRKGHARADEIIVNAFMTVFAYFFGEYKQYMSVKDTKTRMRELQKKDFVSSFNSKSTKRFLNAFMMTQMFDKWIEEREDPRKSAAVAEGLFEMKLSELYERKQEIEIFSSKRRLPWKKKSSNT
ncbi:PREDICTED: DENN domain-containing protein 2A-like [Amphimedon queenslandica]|uniref:UDENN domain-containing protein n=1 Tax=Amphimedon queenslandica TaxID=400682 RepID=A0A1X7U9E6_AMPQE|nr:PREDICTED: DENN domain-containing protein 2A-like [Amphimedon queenslandica]|eukprot:XP_003388654.1 PREDICTED: DENN domain-containing protein 2A-like [Amphimedon queenslandica]